MQPEQARPFIVPVFLPQAGCPRQCVFCDQPAITSQPTRAIEPQRVAADIDRFLTFRTPGRRPVQISFYGGNFLGLAPADIRSLLHLGRTYVEDGRCDHLRFSTRPDTITERALNHLAPYPVKTVEIGVQSMDDGVLALSRRGHTAADAIRALHLLKAYGYQTGVQLMTGLPGQSGDSAVHSAREIAGLSPDFVRIYPTLVMAGSPLARWYRQGRYRPKPLETAIEVVGRMAAVFETGRIPVIRMGLQATDELVGSGRVLAGPLHPAFGHLVLCARMRDRAIAALEATRIRSKPVEIRVHPRDISRLRGHRNRTVALLKKRFALPSLGVIGDDTVPEHHLVVRPAAAPPTDKGVSFEERSSPFTNDEKEMEAPCAYV